MHYFILFVVSVVCLLGCISPQERAANEQARMNRMIGEFGPACYRLGYPANSDQWRNCVMQLAERDQATRGGVSTSFFGSFGSWGSRGGASVGAGVTVGR
jgi:hypothetical protein